MATTTVENRNNSSLNAFAAGNVAGMAGVLCGQPFDTVKVKMQTRKNHTFSQVLRFTRKTSSSSNSTKHYYTTVAQRRPVSATACARKILRRHGTAGFYKGVFPPLLSVGLQKSIAFGTFDYCFHNYSEKNSSASWYTNTILSGSIAGLFNSVIACPVDQVKIAQQMSRQNNVFRLYKTLPAVISREVPGYAIYFTCYEGLSRYNNNNSNTDSKVIKFINGGLSGVLMWSLYYPLDLIKSTAQARNLGHKNVSLSPLSIAKDIYKTRGGISGFYTGITPAVARAFPTHACIFLVYETIKDFKLF